MMQLPIFCVHQVLVLWSMFKLSSAEDVYTITRNLKDTFKIPPNRCLSNIGDQCKSMGGEQKTKNDQKLDCTCQCKINFNNVFGWFNNTWKCESNADVRKLADKVGCHVKQLKHTKKRDEFIFVVPAKKNNIDSHYIGYFALDTSCTLYENFEYLDCNGKWMNMQHASNSFASYPDDPDNQQYIELYDRGDDSFHSYSPSIRGRVIYLKLSCNIEDYCVLLKVRGQRTCPIASKTTTTSAPITTAKTSTTTSTTTLMPASSTSTSESTQPQTSSTQASSTSRQTNKAVTALTTTEEPSISSSNQLFTYSFPYKHSYTETTTQSTKSTNITNKHHNQNRSSASTADNSGMIAGAIGGVAALAIILVILIIIWRKRKRQSPAKRTGSNTADNPAYDRGGDRTLEINGQQAFTHDIDEYSYAYTNNHPIVIKDHNGKALKVVGDSNGQSGNTKVAPGSPPNYNAPVYNTLEEPDYAKLSKSQDMSNEPSYNVLQRQENEWKTKQGPVYDVLEDPSNATQNSEGPIYNTLEDPDYAKLEKAKNTYSGPSYNVLERPESKWPKQGPIYDVLEVTDPNGAPVYDVLEGPESDDQHVYGSLENQDPHIYGALNSPTSASGVAFSGYEDVLYDSTGDVIQSGDIYQELNQAGQQSSDDLYQPLRHPRKSMVMKDMSGVTQSHA